LAFRQLMPWKQATDPQATVLQRYAYTLRSQRQPGGLQFAGTVNEPATVTVQGLRATTFQVAVPVGSGTNVVSVVATDHNGNSATAAFDVDNLGTPKTFTHDANGNLTSDGTRSFEWDARNQLVAVTVGTHRSEFTYDGLQRRVRIRERLDGVIQSDQSVIWCEMHACEERDLFTGAVLRQLFGQGQLVSGGISLFVADHLGSIIASTNTSGVATSRHSYDPWGRLEDPNPSLAAGYTGHGWDATNGFWLTLHRAYDPELGRWLSEDPLRERGDTPNFYAYVRQNPVGLMDPFGLQASGMSAMQSFFHACDFNNYRNQFNRCPEREPKNKPNWNKDPWLLTVGLMLVGGSGTGKYRNKDGSECLYDKCGNLKPDDGSYTYNYESDSSSWRHIKLDVIPDFACAGNYRRNLTKTYR
jgi:RHS repeat-associated protein